VAAHAHGTAGIKAAVLAGIDSIEHGSILDDEAIKMMKEHGTYLVPTLMAGESVYTSARSGRLPDYSIAKGLAVWPMMQQSFRKAHAAGVKIAFGTDSAVTPHGQNAHEFELMVQFGMTPMEAIVAATRSAADLLGRSKDLGTLEPGKYADLVAFEGDPTKDVVILKKPAAVVQGGRVIDLGR
jgi:imidazolonepropionase-like amidohydrolase